MPFEFTLEQIVPIITGLVFVAIAVLQRGYKTYLTEKKTNPSLTFNAAYMLNFWVATTASTAIVGIVPTLLTLLLGDTSSAITFYSIITNAILGYTTAWTALDQMNTSTENKILANANPQQ